MAPIPQETAFKTGHARPLSGEEVVISGMSGIFPKSDSVLEFSENLFNKIDMVTTENSRWVFNHPEVPKHLGQVKGMGKFDAQFFRVHYKQACTMEPMSRKLIEHAYSAIFDSGINPLQLRGQKVGVFIGSTFSESEKLVIYENIQRNGFGITGCNRAMYSNRISYWIDGKGPSYSLDLACASSTACVEHAYRAIKEGQCDAAIVGGCNLCMHPMISLNCRRAGFLCLDGKTKCFDKNGDGYVRSDAISVLFLQRAKDAKRIYSEVYHAKSGYGTSVGEQFLPIRTPDEIKEFLKEFYSEIDVSPDEVEYVEGCGTASSEADRNELKAISEVFAKQRPVKVGCVKSNMGCSEPASGLCALTKICLAYYKGELAANLHYEEPMNDIPAVKNNMVQILSDNAKFSRRFTALNTFSYSGVNIHILLKGHYKPKDPERYKSSIPHLVLASGRQDFCVEKIFNVLSNSPVDPEQIGMLHTIHKYDIPGHMSRGYTILGTNKNKETTCFSQSVEYCPGSARPIWFVYSGMGSQWAGMGAELMRMPIFAAAIEKCHKVLEPKGVDIIRILTDPDKSIYNNILNSFVGIAAVQIGLTDILRELGIVPDNIIGHSVGELGCAYADGCLTAEEMILSAYSRGLVSLETPLIHGSMAAVGLGYKDIISLCPPEIEVACHNSSDSATISGPYDVMKQFVAELNSQGIFAKEVPCSNIAYHSKYIAGAGPGLLKYLSQVIKNPKLRTEKWVSTSVPQEKWDDLNAKYSSAEYHTNNLLNPVLFEETSKRIPTNAIVVEIAPHGLLQAILKRSLSECLHIPLTRRGHADPVIFFLEAIGKLYKAGINPQVDVLYPKIEYPVSTETPLLSHLVEWEHSEDWPQAKYNSKDRILSTERDFVMSIHDDDYKHLKGHVRDGVCVIPEAAYIAIVWNTLAMYRGEDYNKMSVEFFDIDFHSEIIISDELPVKLKIMINKGNHNFEVSFENATIVSGNIQEISVKDDSSSEFKDQDTEINYVTLTSEDIYTMLNLRGFSYKNKFKSIMSSNLNKTKAKVIWAEEWITFIDSLIQLNAFARVHDGVSVPKLIKNIRIDTEKHTNAIRISDKLLEADLYPIYDCTRCGGVEITGIVFIDKPVRDVEPDILQTRTFIPHFLVGNVDIHTALKVFLQIVVDNVPGSTIKTAEELSSSYPVISTAFKNASLEIEGADFINSNKTESDINILLMDNLLNDEKKMQIIEKKLPEDTFIVTFEKQASNCLSNSSFNIISTMSVQSNLTMMLLKKLKILEKEVAYISVSNKNNFMWINEIRNELDSDKRVVIVSERESYTGLIGFIKGMKKLYGNKINLVLIEDPNNYTFDSSNEFFKEQLKKNLTINILKKGVWGGYYLISDSKCINSNNVQLISHSPGDITTLSWIESPPNMFSTNLVEVIYSGVSIEDVQHAAGKFVKENKAFGMDFSGIDNTGNRVMGLVPGGALATKVMADPDLLWPVPENWSLEDAATVPLPYVYAYYCLTVKSELCKGYTILVNGAEGAVGQAVIALALATDCDVFATVSDNNAKKFLLKLFPQLKENQVGNSYSSAHDSILGRDKKCDLTINTMSGIYRQAALKCGDRCSIFIDLCEYDTTINDTLGMYFLTEEKNYLTANLSTIFMPEYIEEKKILQQRVAEGIAKGIVRPLSRIVYDPSDISRAFRLFSTNKLRGKVMIRMNHSDNLRNLNYVMPSMSFSANGTYIVVCNESPIGVELVERLIKKGANNLILHLKSDSISGYFHTKLLSWSKYNVSINIVKDDLDNMDGCKKLLQEGKKLGPILGIFIVQDFRYTAQQDISEIGNFDTECVKKIRAVAELDMLSKEHCDELKHFVVLNYSSHTITDRYVSSVIDQICQIRSDNNLPALVLHVRILKELESKISLPKKIRPQTLTSVFNSLEKCLKFNYNNVVTFNVNNNDESFVNKISKIIGIKNIDEIHEAHYLPCLYLSDLALYEIQQSIKEKYYVNYPIEVLRKITVKSLKDLCHNIIKPKTSFDSGLGAFYTFIDDDEWQVTEPLITMRTMFSNVQAEEELDPKATYLMLIPGFEGHHQIFRSVCERLKVQAVTFQLTPDLTNDSIQLMASSFMKFMKNRFELKTKFYLLGYSFGVNIALELANLIEKEGHVGVVYCLDSSPDVLKIQLEAYIGNMTEEELQNNIVTHMFKLMSGRESEELSAYLQKKDNWADKVEACVNHLRGLVKYSRQYIRSVLEGAYSRIMLARKYEPNFILESELILLKAIPHPKITGLSYDYNLSRYTRNPVQVFDLESDHVLAPQDCRVANIVNRFLDPKLKEEFSKKNLLETYLADAFKFL